MSKLTFYQAELRLIDDKEVSQLTKGIPVEERIGECPECKGTIWWLLPKEGAAVREGGKPYCECLGCGYTTHL